MEEFTVEELLDLVKRAATDSIWRCQRTRADFPAWAAIRDRFGLGSTSAAKLCVRLGIDPESGETLDEQASVAKPEGDR